MQRFFDDLPRVWDERSSETAHTITELFFPASQISEQTVDAVDAAIAAASSTRSGAKRLLGEGRDGLLRAAAGPRGRHPRRGLSGRVCQVEGTGRSVSAQTLPVNSTVVVLWIEIRWSL